MPVHDPTDLQNLEEALWTLVAGGALPGQRRTLLSRLLCSPEFHAICLEWRSGPAAAHALEEPGRWSATSQERFVRVAYECLLGRPADDSGLAHYVAALGSGETRTGVLRSLVLSEEFEQRYRGLPRDVQLCELANPAKWDNEEWVDLLRSLGLSDDKLSMHRKPYEFAQLLFGCRRLGALRADSTIVSVGAGHELVLYWLANHARRVIGTDLYEGVWRHMQGREGNPDVMRRPEAYAPFPYRQAHLIFMQMDGRHLAFRDGSFDIAYSLSSIEHFGGMREAVATVREMARVLKPGGVLALATEYVIQGPSHDETFQPAEFAALIDQPGLELVEPIDTQVYRRYAHSAVDLYKNPFQTPHMVVRFNDTVFTTVMAFLRRT